MEHKSTSRVYCTIMSIYLDYKYELCKNLSSHLQVSCNSLNNCASNCCKLQCQEYPQCVPEALHSSRNPSTQVGLSHDIQTDTDIIYVLHSY